MGRLYSRRLKNGLVVGFYQKRSPLFALTFTARAGSRYEAQELAGVGRVCLDSLFEGSARYPSAYLLAHALDSVSVGPVHLEASAEFLCVSLCVDEMSWSEALTPFVDLLFHPVFDQIRFRSGRFLEGHAPRSPLLGIKDDPELLRVAELTVHHLLGPAAGQAFFQPDFRGMATEDDRTSEMTREDLRVFHREYFAPDNCVLVLSGSGDPDAVLDRLAGLLEGLPNPESGTEWNGLAGTDENQGRLRASSVLQIADHHPPSGLRAPIFESVDGKFFDWAAQPSVAFSWSLYGDAPTKEASLVFSGLHRLLAGGQSSRLPHRFYQAATWVDGFFSDCVHWTDFAWMSFSFRVAPDRVRVVLGELVSEFKRLATESLDLHPEELPRVLGAWVRSERAIYDSALLASQRIATDLLLRGASAESFEEIQSQIFQITPQSIQSAAQAFLVPARSAVLIQGEVPRGDRFAVESLIRKGHE